MGDYKVALKDMPTTVKAVTIKNEDDTFTILVNSKLNYEQQHSSYEHEIEHIGNCDFEKEQNISTLEHDAHYNHEYKDRIRMYNAQIGLLGIVRAFENRCKDLHEMADYLNVTEEFLSEVLECYKGKYGVYVKIDNYIIRFIPNLQITKLL